MKPAPASASPRTQPRWGWNDMGANPRGRDSSLTPTPGCWTDPRWGKQLPPFSESQRYSVPERRDAIPLGHEWLFPQRGKQTLPLPESQVDNVSSLWDGILLGYGCFFPQRGSVPKPGVGRRHVGLPWDFRNQTSNPNGVVSGNPLRCRQTVLTSP